MHKCSAEMCPIVTLVNVLERKWALRIIKEIYAGKAHFNQLKRSMAGITAAVLSKRLKELEEEKVIMRKVLKQDPLEVEYYLGEQAKELMDCWEIHGSDVKGGNT